jgi:carboxyl-terminal processing protease
MMALLGLVGGLIPAALWARQQLAAIRGDTRAARRWRWGILGGQAALVVGIGLLISGELYQVGMLSPPNRDRAAAFDHFDKAMATYYPYFEEKGIDWDAVVARYRPQVIQAPNDRTYYAAIERMLSELDDAHTGVVPSQAMAEGCFFAATREIEGQAVVIQVGPTGNNLGLGIGAVVLEVDGQPLEAALNAVDPRLRKGSTPRQRRSRAFQFLTHTPYGEQRDLAFETADGDDRTATLTCDEETRGAESEGGGDIWDFLLPRVKQEVVSRRLPSGLGYLRIPTFGVDLVDEFDAALDGLMDTPGLILDLRSNSGGNSTYADQMAGRLLDETFVYGIDHYTQRMITRGGRAQMPFHVEPRGEHYAGPVVVIIETLNMSTAEQFLIALMDSGRVETVGRPTGGASGNPIVFRLPGERNVRFSTADFHRNDGTPIEGVGLTPDVTVTWTVEDFRQGRDPDLDAAEALLLNKIAPRP